jgi:hypothetical protein
MVISVSSSGQAHLRLTSEETEMQMEHGFKHKKESPVKMWSQILNQRHKIHLIFLLIWGFQVGEILWSSQPSKTAGGDEVADLQYIKFHPRNST